MKRFRNFGFQFEMGCLFIASSALACFASCAAPQHSGYQGIPVRNAINRGAIEQIESAGAHAYSGLPQRVNQPAAPDDFEGCTENAQFSSGYSGIPQANSENAGVPDDVPDMLPVNSAGYRGIPPSVDVGRGSFDGNSEFARASSAFVRRR